MPETDNTVRLHRVLRAPPELIYKAFLDPDALCPWLPPCGYLGGKLTGSTRRRAVAFT